jgi:hypothetical protein
MMMREAARMAGRAFRERLGIVYLDLSGDLMALSLRKSAEAR